MQAYWCTGGRHTCGLTCWHIYWSNLLAHVTKGNIYNLSWLLLDTSVVVVYNLHRSYASCNLYGVCMKASQKFSVPSGINTRFDIKSRIRSIKENYGIICGDLQAANPLSVIIATPLFNTNEVNLNSMLTVLCIMFYSMKY